MHCIVYTPIFSIHHPRKSNSNAHIYLSLYLCPSPPCRLSFLLSLNNWQNKRIWGWDCKITQYIRMRYACVRECMCGWECEQLGTVRLAPYASLYPPLVLATIVIIIGARAHDKRIQITDSMLALFCWFNQIWWRIDYTNIAIQNHTSSTSPTPSSIFNACIMNDAMGMQANISV